MTPQGMPDDPLGNARIGASATTRIKRSDFGLTWNAALETGGLLVGDNLKIESEVPLIRSQRERLADRERLHIVRLEE
jgi:polyisoprenoid-binding protein YceI